MQTRAMGSSIAFWGEYQCNLLRAGGLDWRGPRQPAASSLGPHTRTPLLRAASVSDICFRHLFQLSPFPPPLLQPSSSPFALLARQAAQGLILALETDRALVITGVHSREVNFPPLVRAAHDQTVFAPKACKHSSPGGRWPRRTRRRLAEAEISFPGPPGLDGGRKGGDRSGLSREPALEEEPPARLRRPRCLAQSVPPIAPELESRHIAGRPARGLG
jgi:hypothetical protein